jgi:DHA2 family multidrug resistance protein
MTVLSPVQRAWATAALMLSNLMLAIDTTVVNVSLPHLQGSLSASPEQITWVVTSYIVAQVVMTPIAGWLAARAGAKNMLLICTVLFTGTSVLCGLATSLPQMTLYRFLQGATGAPLAPLAQAATLSLYPPEKLSRASATYAMAGVVGPCLGPVLGAWLTDAYSWRWCFFVNVPAGILSLIMVWSFVPRDVPKPRKFDFLGFVSLGVAVACLQLVLDRGPSKDWFSSPEICAEATAAAIAAWVFVAHTLTARHPLFSPAIFADRNFVTAAVLTTLFSVALFSSVALMPLMTQGVLGYPVLLSGLVVLPRGMIMMVMLQFMGRLDSMVDRRLLMSVGLTVIAASFWQMSHFDLNVRPQHIAATVTLQGLGQSMVMVPLVTLGFLTLRQDLRNDAAAISNLVRNLGGSLGIAVIQGVTLVNGQTMHASLAAHVQPGDPVMGQAFPLSVDGAMRLNEEITRQAGMVAFVDDFMLMAAISLFSAPLLFLLRSRGAPPRR